MAYIRKHAGSYQIRVKGKRDPRTGKRKDHYKGGFPTEAKARKAAAAFEYEVKHGHKPYHAKVTFASFALEWLEQYQVERKISTVRIRKKEIDYLSRYIAEARLTDITKPMIQEIWTGLRQEGFGRSTILGTRTCARMIFEFAIDMDILSSNPVDRTKVFKEQRTIQDVDTPVDKPKYMERVQLEELLAVIREQGTPEDNAIFTTLAYSGFRLGELLGLQWKHVDQQRGQLHIRQNLYRDNNQLHDYHLLTPKTASSERSITMDESVMKLLHKHRIWQQEHKLQVAFYMDDGFVFAHMNGYPHLHKTINYRLQQYVKKTSFAHLRFTPHSLRHTHASLLMESALVNGSDITIKSIMDRLGHTDHNMLLNIYAHTTKQGQEKASHMFSEHMGRS